MNAPLAEGPMTVVAALLFCLLLARASTGRTGPSLCDYVDPFLGSGGEGPQGRGGPRRSC